MIYGESLSSEARYHSSYCDICANRGPCQWCGRNSEGKWYVRSQNKPIDQKGSDETVIGSTPKGSDPE
jgi:hypothetical protein